MEGCNKVGKIADERPLILITCSGVSNTGKLTAQVGGILAERTGSV